MNRAPATPDAVDSPPPVRASAAPRSPAAGQRPTVEGEAPAEPDPARSAPVTDRTPDADPTPRHTPHSSPGGAPAAARRRFVLLLHREPTGGEHVDLMIEAGAALATWRFSASPVATGPGQVLPGRRLADHRRLYLEYEGEVRGRRGHVRRLEAGTCRVDAALDDRWEVDFEGTSLTGPAVLRRAAPDRWELTWQPPAHHPA